MEIIGFKDFWKQNKNLNESLELEGSNIDEIDDKFIDIMNGAFGTIHEIGHDEYGLDSDGNKIQLTKEIEFGPYYISYNIDTQDSTLNFGITYSVSDKSTEEMIDDLESLGFSVDEKTIEPFEDDVYIYRLSGSAHVFIKVDYEKIFKEIIAKLQPSKYDISENELSMQWGEWVLPQDLSGYVITKVLSDESINILDKICQKYNLSYSEQEKGYVLIQPK